MDLDSESANYVKKKASKTSQFSLIQKTNNFTLKNKLLKMTEQHDDEF